jgi:hypothetical protein
VRGIGASAANVEVGTTITIRRNAFAVVVAALEVVWRCVGHDGAKRDASKFD